MRSIVILAGGTGGHVFPALAVAEGLQEKGWNLAWMGTREGLEAEIVPKAGIPLYFISIQGLRKRGWLGYLLLPFRLTFALVQALKILHRLKPSVVLGMGGFVSGPGGIAAWLLRYPLIIHEQNSIAGFTNRLLAKLAVRTLESFPDSFRSSHAIRTGLPIRKTLQPRPSQALHFTSTRTPQVPLKILIIGGSRGALILNQVCPAAFHLMPLNQRPEVWHQCGKGFDKMTESAYQAAGVLARVVPFIHDMQEAYAWADLVICRAGASTLTELMNLGKACILIPFPYAVDDHQTYNGRFLEKAGAAILIPQSSFAPAQLADDVMKLSQNSEQLLNMARAAKELSQPEALAKVVSVCIEVAHVHSS